MTAQTAAAIAFFVGVIGSLSVVVIWWKTAGEDLPFSTRVFQRSLEAFAGLAVVAGGLWLLLGKLG